MKCLIAGAGGFIGGHLMQKLISNGHEVVCADIKSLDTWFQLSKNNQNFSKDLRSYDNCLEVTKNIDYVFNLACNMGGMGFIENNKAECMLSVLVNTNLLRASKENNCSRFFFSSSACV